MHGYDGRAGLGRQPGALLAHSGQNDQDMHLASHCLYVGLSSKHTKDKASAVRHGCNGGTSPGRQLGISLALHGQDDPVDGPCACSL